MGNQFFLKAFNQNEIRDNYREKWFFTAKMEFVVVRKITV